MPTTAHETAHEAPRGIDGDACCTPRVRPSVAADDAARLARVAKALGDPIRLQIIDVLRRHGGTVCVCEITPLFDVGQPTVSHHLRVLRDAGLVASERRGQWAYYTVTPGSLDAFGAWVTAGAAGATGGDDGPA